MSKLSPERASKLLEDHGPGRATVSERVAIFYVRAPAELAARLQLVVASRKQARLKGSLPKGTPVDQASIIRVAVSEYLDRCVFGDVKSPMESPHETPTNG